MERTTDIIDHILSKFRGNKLIRAFLSNSQNYDLLLESLRNPTLTNQRNLDKAFKRFYTNARTIKYMSNLIYYYALNYDQKINITQKRFPLKLDNPITENLTSINFIEDFNEDVPVKAVSKSGKLLDQIESPRLFYAIEKLTTNQARILEMYYLHDFKDNEIKDILNISQQAVSKARKRALAILRQELSECNINNFL